MHIRVLRRHLSINWTFHTKLVINGPVTLTTEAEKVLLVSCYELGRQPLALATPLSLLEKRGISSLPVDLSVGAVDDRTIEQAEVIAVAVPMHTALRIGLLFADRVRAVNPGCRLCFFGPYATLNAELVFRAGVDAVLSGECDEALATWIAGTETSSHRERWAPPPFLSKMDYPVPSRDRLPGIERYVHLEREDDSHVTVGTVEASRGCRHHCRHCPLPPIYQGRFFVVPPATVLADIRQLVNQGARHINFADPDFLNGPGHALEVVRAMHREHPQLTFDFTAKVEHLLKRRYDLEELKALGCEFIVSAIESLSDRVLDELDKGHNAADARRALHAVRNAGIALKPTFVAFTPWTSLDDYRELFRWIADEGLESDVEPIQMALRLLVPPGSLLAEHPGLAPYLGELDRVALTYRWDHPDPRMDDLQKRAMQLVELGAREKWRSSATFAQLAKLVSIRFEESESARRTPRLTEAWFC